MSQTDTRTSLLAAVAAQAKAELAPLVQVIDQGHYPGEYMHHLGALGGFGAGIPAELGGQGLDLATQIEATTLVGQECGSTAFLVWCQSSCAWYLLHSPNEAVRNRYLARVSKGELLSGTGMSNAVKQIGRASCRERVCQYV